MPATIVVATLLFVVSSIVFDLRTFRIPNALTGPAIVAGFTLHAWFFGWVGIRESVAGFGLAIGLLFAPFALGGIGGGDVKMMGAIGALLGPRLLMGSLFAGLLLGGLIAVVQLARRSRLREKLLATWHMVTNALVTRSLAPLKAPALTADAVILPYSLPLGLGTVGILALSMAATP